MAEAATKPRPTGETVTIACKLPNGLAAQLIEGGKPKGPAIFLRGSAAQRRTEIADKRYQATDVPPVMTVAGGYGLTSGVDAAWAAEWFKQNSDYPPVARGLIFMAKSDAAARDEAREKAEVLSGLEPINPHAPEKDKRLGAVGIQKADFVEG